MLELELYISKVATWDGWEGVLSTITNLDGPSPANLLRETRRFFVLKLAVELVDKDAEPLVPAPLIMRVWQIMMMMPLVYCQFCRALGLGPDFVLDHDPNLAALAPSAQRAIYAHTLATYEAKFPMEALDDAIWVDPAVAFPDDIDSDSDEGVPDAKRRPKHGGERKSPTCKGCGTYGTRVDRCVKCHPELAVKTKKKRTLSKPPKDSVGSEATAGIYSALPPSSDGPAAGVGNIGGAPAAEALWRDDATGELDETLDLLGGVLPLPPLPLPPPPLGQGPLVVAAAPKATSVARKRKSVGSAPASPAFALDGSVTLSSAPAVISSDGKLLKKRMCSGCGAPGRIDMCKSCNPGGVKRPIRCSGCGRAGVWRSKCPTCGPLPANEGEADALETGEADADGGGALPPLSPAGMLLPLLASPTLPADARGPDEEGTADAPANRPNMPPTTADDVDENRAIVVQVVMPCDRLLRVRTKRLTPMQKFMAHILKDHKINSGDSNVEMLVLTVARTQQIVEATDSVSSLGLNDSDIVYASLPVSEQGYV